MTHSARHLLITVCSTAMLAGVPGQAVFAQTAPPAAAPVATMDSATVGDIVVTAQRREERLQQVPIAITALSTADLEKRNVVDLSRLDMISPSFTFGRSGQDARPAIRGVITETVTAQADPTIGYYVDGVYQSRVQQASMPLVDVQRIEIQNGPQGTLYGRNTYGGNISITNHQPDGRFAAGITTEVGSLTQPRFEGFLNLRASDSLQFRFAGLYSRRKGYVKSVNNPDIALGGAHEVVARGSVRYAPGGGFEAVLTGAYWHEFGQGGGTGYKIAGTLVNPNTGRRSIYGIPVDINPSLFDGVADLNGFDLGVPNYGKGPWRNDWDYKPYEDTAEYYGTLNMSYDLGFATIRSITGFTRFKTDRSAENDQTGIVYPRPGITNPIFPASGYQLLETDVTTVSQEVQLASDTTRPLQWIIGGFYLNDSVDETNTQYRDSPTAVGANTGNRSKVNLDSYAAYAQASYFVVADVLRLTGGLRYTNETKGFRIESYTIPQTAGIITGGRSITGTTGGRPNFHAFTYRAGVDFFATPKNMLYATVSSGYLTGGFNNNITNPAIPATYQPQKITAYEIGAKNTFFDDRLQLNFSLFNNDERNVQLQIFNQQANLAYTAAAGKARARGAEIVAVAVPTDGLRLSAGLSRLDAKYTRYLRPNPFAATPGDPATLDLSGNRIPLSPKWKTTLDVQYDLDAGFGTFTPSVTWLHSDHFYSTDFNTVLDYQKSYNKVDAALAFTPTSKRFTLRAYVINIGNVAVIQRSVYGNNQRLQVGYSAPREYGITASARF